MSSTNPPIYNFSGINFNSSYYIIPSSGSGVGLGVLKTFFLLKNGTDTATGPITFKNPTYISQTINLSNPTNNGTINFTNSSNNILSSLYTSADALIVDIMNMANGFNVVSNGTNILKALSTGLELSIPYSLNYTSIPTLTSLQVGFSHSTNTNVSFTFNSVSSNTIYNSNNQTSLPIGVYSFISSYISTPSSFVGSVSSGTGFQIGYCLGTSSVASSNTKTSLYNGISNLTYNATMSGVSVFSVGSIINITTANSYITSFITANVSAYTSGSYTIAIPNYTVYRIA